MSGDDHSPTQAPGGTASHFDRYKALSPAGCVVANWDCVRSTSYLYPNATLTNAQAAGYIADGFEVGAASAHLVVPDDADRPPTSSATYYDTQLAAVPGEVHERPGARSRAGRTASTGRTGPRTRRSSSRAGSGWTRNYYHYPGPWIGAKPGFMNGGGFPMRFADLDGTPIDVYQQNTNLTDESTTNFQTTIDALLDNAVGAAGLLRRVRREHAHRQRGAASGRRGDRRRRPGAERAGDLLQAAARLGRRPQRSTIRGLGWNARHADVRHDRRRRRERPADDAAGAGPDRDADRDHAGPARRSPTPCRRSRASSTPCSPPQQPRTWPPTRDRTPHRSARSTLASRALSRQTNERTMTARGEPRCGSAWRREGA